MNCEAVFYFCCFYFCFKSLNVSLKNIFFFLFIVYSPLLVGQNISVNKKLQRIDELIFKDNKLLDAEKETNQLYEWLSENENKKAYQGPFIDVLLYKSYILFTLNKGPNKALEISLKALDKAKEYGFPEKEYRACLIIAIMYESTNEFDMCRKYLNKSEELCKKHHLENIYSIYCIRMSSYYRLIKEEDSAIYFAYKGLDFSKKYKNEREITDVYLLLGMLLSKNNAQEAVKFSLLSIEGFKKRKDYGSVVSQYCNISLTYLKNKKFEKALFYNDSALLLSKKHLGLELEESHVAKIRARIYDSLGYFDSAYYYFKKYHETNLLELSKMENAEVNRITEKYESNKKEAIIKNQNLLLIFIGIVGLLIAIGSVLLARKNNKINEQNKVISIQVKDLSKSLAQKQVLLSELQHRVKNNLQHVISILEIQKESVNFNTIEEVIRGNQNRIHSMTLLHEKLNVFESVTDIYLNKYISELSLLVKDSYINDEKDVILNVICEIEKVSVEKVLPLGFIIVELVSNSMKHGFKNQNYGEINISITKDPKNEKIKLKYADNGVGFDFNLESDKGLGLEIIKGLIDQLEGRIETKNSNGFELIILFK